MRTTTPIAKISPPSLGDIFARRQLFRIIDKKRRRSAIWVSGPPGAGKTTLVASYLKVRKLPYLWYQLDDGDNDIGSFFYFMGIAADDITADVDSPSLPLFSQECPLSLSKFTRNYFREFYGRVKSPSVIVFDDYQEVSSDSPFHKVIRDCIENVTDGVSIIIISRHNPPSEMARIRARGLLEIMGKDALNLTMADSKGIAQSLKLDNQPSEEMLRHLHERSGGWTTGLILLLKEWQAFSQNADLQYRQTPEIVFDYLAGEIFDKVDDQTKDFLIKTAFLPMMTVQMAAELTGKECAEEILPYLFNNNCFTDKRSVEPIYEYHSLFREFLISRAKQLFSVDEMLGIRQKAAKTLESAGQTDEAVALYIEAGDWAGAVRILLNIAPRLISQGRGQTLASWLAKLPQDIRDKEPWLLYWNGVCHMLIDPVKSRSCFQSAFSMFNNMEDPAGIYLTWCGIVNNIFHTFRDFSQLDPWIAILDRIRIRYPDFPSDDIEARVTYAMFEILLFRNQMHPDFHSWAENALQLYQHDPDKVLKMEVVFFLVFYCHLIGDFARASILIDTLRDSGNALIEAPPLSLLGWKATEAFYQWLIGEQENAIDSVNEGLLISKEQGVHHLDYVLLGQGISAALTSGDMAAARNYLNEMKSVLTNGAQNDRCFYYYLAAWYSLSRGDLPGALQYAETGLKQCEDLGAPWQEFLTRLILIHILHEVGEDQRADAHLSRAHNFAYKTKSPFCRFMYLLTIAMLRLTRDDNDEGLRALEQAMEIGRTKGLINFWGWRTSVMSRLCAKALESGIEVDYVKGLIRKHRLTACQESVQNDEWPWPLKVYTMGRFSVSRDGEMIRFNGKTQKKPMEMLKILITLGGRNIREDKIRETLWPEAEDSAAHSAFTTTLSRLRKLTGHDAISYGDGMLFLNPKYCWVDVWVLERLLSQAERNYHSSQSGGRQVIPVKSRNNEIKFLDSVDSRLLNLYHGPFLGDEDTSWAFPLRERLSSRFVRYLRTRGRELEEAGEYDQAITLYQKGIEADPLSEGLYRCLMACHHARGSQAEAAAVYHRCRNALSALLNIPPSQKTDSLYLKIRSNST